MINNRFLVGNPFIYLAHHGRTAFLINLLGKVDRSSVRELVQRSHDEQGT